MEKLLRLIVAVHTRLTESKDERGATATEYALLVGLIAIVIAVGVGLFGTALNSFFGSLATTVTGWV